MKTFLSIEAIYLLIGIVVLMLAFMTLLDKAHPKRLTTALFWFLFGIIFLAGDLMVVSLSEPVAHRLIGCMVIIIALLAGTGQLAMGHYRESSDKERLDSAKKLGSKIFLPAVLIPIVTVVCALGLKGVSVGGFYLVDQRHVTLASLTIACGVALLVAWKMTGGTPLQAVRESRRIVDSIGWAAILPQMLAMLGGVFVVANTGQSIEHVVSLFVSPDNRFILVVIYCLGMAGFTMIMGNAFAAFPVMTAGIALPFLILGHDANPAAVVAIGMYSGYCGTLMTPMGANFNIVPAALLGLADKYQVIKVQIPTALSLLMINMVLMYLLAF